MRPLLLLGCFLFVSTSAFPSTVSKAEECAACLFAVHSMKSFGQQNSSSLFEFCSKIDDCDSSMTHCDIVDALPALPAVESARFVAGLHTSVRNARELCLIDRKSVVLESQSVLCTLCSLVENILHFFNDSIFGGKFEHDLQGVLYKVCNVIGGVASDFCFSLLAPTSGGGGFNAIFQGLRDSLGPFYSIVAGQGLGCPPMDQLDKKCISKH